MTTITKKDLDYDSSVTWLSEPYVSAYLRV